MKKASLIITLFLIIAIVLADFLYYDLTGILKLAVSGDTQAISKAISGAGAAAILISILINTFISVMGVIPSVFLTGANILVFGFFGGFLVSWAGEFVGASISFVLYRAGARTILKIPPDHMKVIRAISLMPGVKQIYFLAVLRLAPFFPSGVINLFGALTTVPLVNFLIATALGKFPALLLESAFSYNMLTISKNYINLGISILVAVLLYFIIKKEFSRLKNIS